MIVDRQPVFVFDADGVAIRPWGFADRLTINDHCHPPNSSTYPTVKENHMNNEGYEMESALRPSVYLDTDMETIETSELPEYENLYAIPAA